MGSSSDDRAVEVLQKQVDSLQKQLDKVTGERDELSLALSDVAAERDTIQAAVGGDTDKLTKAEARVAELEGQHRDRTHLDKFAELAKAAGAKDGAIKHLWKLGEYKAEGDEVDEKALGKLVDRLKKEADYAFGAAAAPEDKDSLMRQAARDAVPSRAKYGLEIRGEPPTPPASGRGNCNEGGDGTIITAEMRGDPKFMLDPRNKQLIGDAAREGRFR